MPTATRGTNTNFTAEFKDANGVPLPILDESSYPTVQVLDPDGLIFTQGVGKVTGPGSYIFELSLQTDVTLSTPDKKWMVEWAFVTTSLTTHEFSEEFEVVDQLAPKVEDREPTDLTMEGRSERVYFKIGEGPNGEAPVAPGEIAFIMLLNGVDIIHNITEVAANEDEKKPSSANRKIVRVDQDNQIVFYFDTDALDQGKYMVIWETRQTELSPNVQEVRIVQVPPLIFWLLAGELRLLIDKLQKRVGRVQSYTDADLFEYIRKGLEYLNGVFPPTSFTLNNFINPSFGLVGWLMMASAMYGLTSQQILEIDLSFDFSGQEVTLTYDHVSHLDGVISRMIDMLRTEFKESKRQIFIRIHGQGATGVRPYRLSLMDRVMKIRSGSIAGELGPILGSAGLV